MKMQNKNHRPSTAHGQRGNAIVWILVGVALFAALGFAFTSSSRTSSSLLSDTEAEAYATQIIQYGNEVKAAVKRLQLRGCTDTEISFENDVITGYTNPNAPDNKSCHVFNIAGGGLNWKEINEKYLDNSYSSVLLYGIPNPSGDSRILGVGTSVDGSTGNELYLTTSHIKLEICKKINQVFEVSDKDGTPPSSGLHNSKFQGSYNSPSEFVVDASLSGKKQFCFNHSGLGRYIMLQVLIAR